MVHRVKWMAAGPLVLVMAIWVSAAEKEVPSVSKKMVKSEKEWEVCLTPEQYQVLRKKGTEAPFTGKYYDFHEEGVYLCAACGNELFGSKEKFDSGTGWPSYFAPVGPGAVEEEVDNSLGLRRVEVKCARCGSHLGHVFDDGPAPTHKRFCINSAALQFQKKKGMSKEETSLKKATFGAGCFWGVEKIFAKIPGVVSTRVGYAGGSTREPTYEEVCTGRTGHAEAMELTYDPAKVSYGELLITFWEWHDPTTLNRQGPDVGTQYRSVIFTHDEEQAEIARRSKQLLEEAKVYPSPIVTEIVPAGTFTTAEEYHQKYLQKNPFGYCSHHLQTPRVRQLLRGKLIQPTK